MGLVVVKGHKTQEAIRLRVMVLVLRDNIGMVAVAKVLLILPSLHRLPLRIRLKSQRRHSQNLRQRLNQRQPKSLTPRRLCPNSQLKLFLGLSLQSKSGRLICKNY